MNLVRVAVVSFALSGMGLLSAGTETASAVTTLPPPALSATALAGGEAIVVGRSPTSELWYQVSTGGTFGGWQSLGTTDAASQPATVLVGGNLSVFFRATDNEVHYFAQGGVSSGPRRSGTRQAGLTFNPEQNLGGVIAGNPAAAVDGNGTIIVVALNSAGNVFTDQLPNQGTWTGWVPLDGILVGQLALATLGGNVYLLGLNDAGLAWTIEWTAGTTKSWGGWTSLSGVFQSGTSLSGVSDGSAIHVHGVNSDGILFEATGSGTTWSGWTPLDGVLAAAPSIVATSSSLFSFGTNPAGELWDRQYTTSWQALNPLDGILETGPVAVASGANAYVFGLATDGSLWYRQWNGTSFGSWTSLGGALATA